MKKLIAALMMLSLVSAANASNTKVDGRCDFLIFSKKCECEANTKNESVWDMCVAGASTAGKKIVDANAIVFSIKGLAFVLSTAFVSSVAAHLLLEKVVRYINGVYMDQA